MNIITWLLFGLIVGIIANALDPQPNRGGLLGSILLGIGGAFLGGFLANLIFGVGVLGFDLTSFLIAVSGSLLLLFIGRAVRRA